MITEGVGKKKKRQSKIGRASKEIYFWGVI